MSVKLDIYTDIKAKLASDVTAIKDTLIWNGQIDAEKKEKAKAYPLVYIEFSNMSWDITKLNTGRIGTTGGLKTEQSGKFIVTIHIVFWRLEDETMAFSLIDTIIENVFFAILKLDGTYYGPLLRIAERQDVNHDNVIDWQIDFSCGAFQSAQVDIDLTEVPGGTLDVSLTRTIDIDNDTIRTGDGT
jgi:hypothetical protein